MKVSRRRLLAGLAGLASKVTALDSRMQQCRYRADAVLYMFGTPLLTRRGVGTAFLTADERKGDSGTVIRLHFAGISDPKRACGILYAGSHEEWASEQRSSLRAVSYFGFVTAPDEEKKEGFQYATLQSEDSYSFVAVQGRHEPGCAHRERACVALPGKTWRNLADLTGQIRSLFSAADTSRSDLPYPGAVPATFLYTMFTTVRSRQRRWAGAYVHNGRLYRLETESTGESLGAVRLTGHIHDVRTKDSSSFRLWLEPGYDLPRRIEFQPRSCLRIILEREER